MKFEDIRSGIRVKGRFSDRTGTVQSVTDDTFVVLFDGDSEPKLPYHVGCAANFDLLLRVGGVTTAAREVQIGERGLGMKYDAGKQQARLIFEGFPLALSALSDVATMGAEKYAAHSWQHVENAIERYTDAGYRHMLSRLQGEELDSESGLLHEAHELWNKLAVLELKLRQKKEKA